LTKDGAEINGSPIRRQTLISREIVSAKASKFNQVQ